jgi:hypothetical protein
MKHLVTARMAAYTTYRTIPEYSDDGTLAECIEACYANFTQSTRLVGATYKIEVREQDTNKFISMTIYMEKQSVAWGGTAQELLDETPNAS